MFDVATQMFDAFAGDGGVAFRFRQNECALQYGLSVKCEAFGRSF
jgi:hypothetical protein